MTLDDIAHSVELIETIAAKSNDLPTKHLARCVRQLTGHVQELLRRVDNLTVTMPPQENKPC